MDGMAGTEIKLTPRDIIGALLALGGTYLFLTGGDSSELTVPLRGLIWGILSAVSLTFYTLDSGPLLKLYSTPLLMGWGMIVGGTGMVVLMTVRVSLRSSAAGTQKPPGKA